MSLSPHVVASDSAASAGTNLLSRLMALTHFMQMQTMSRVSESGRYARLSVAFTDYLVLLAERDRAPGELAALLGVSKQASSKIIQQMSGLGLIGRRVNPQDSRSSLLSLTAKGNQLLKDGVQAANELLSRMAAAIGQRRLSRLLKIFDRLAQALDDSSKVHPAFVESTFAAKFGNRPVRLAVQIPRLTKLFHERLSESTGRLGYSDVRPGHTEMLGMIDEEGSRLQHLAMILGVSKQAVAVSAAELEQLGYVTREEVPEDRRQVVVHVSARGRKLLRTIASGVSQLQMEIQSIVGAEDYDFLDQVTAVFHTEFVEKSDGAAALRIRIDELCRSLLDELGPAASLALAQRLITMTRGQCP